MGLRGYFALPGRYAFTPSMTLFQLSHKRDVLLITLAALVVRLAALPWAQTVHADAVSRVHIAYEWLLDPHYIKDGYWGPLHHYLNAFFMLLFPGKVTGPVMLNILCASFTAIPLHGAALNLFRSRWGAGLAASLYVLSPIVLWTSLQPLSEVSYGLFVALALFTLTGKPNEQHPWRAPAWAGLFMTLAAATRYEAWVLIAAFTLVLVLLRPWREVVVFWCFAMLFPATWMLGNLLEYGDALYSVNQNDVWNMGKEGINDELTAIERMKRLFFFPWSLGLNVSPPVVALLLGGLVWGGLTRQLTRSQLAWLIPFAAMVVVFQKKAWEGSLMLHHRFLVTWLVLLLPFVPVALLGTRWRTMRTAIMTLGLISVLPMTLRWNKVHYTERLGEGTLGQAMEELAMGYYREMEVVPRLYGTDTDDLLQAINARAVPGEGLLVDFMGWDRSYYLGLHAIPNTLVAGGAKHEEYDPEVLTAFLAKYPKGYLVFSRSGKLQEKASLRGARLEFEGVSQGLVIEGPEVYRGNHLFSYRVGADTTAIDGANAMMGPRPVLPTTMDVAYFDDLIRRNEPWFSRVQRQAYHDGVPVDTALRRNAAYMLSL